MKNRSIVPTSQEKVTRDEDFIVSKTDLAGKITYGIRSMTSLFSLSRGKALLIASIYIVGVSVYGYMAQGIMDWWLHGPAIVLLTYFLGMWLTRKRFDVNALLSQLDEVAKDVAAGRISNRTFT